jgi:glycerol-3-phosphate dehydrogenase
MSTRERRRLLRLAPRWTRPLACVLDTRGRGVAYRALLGAGLWLNELLRRYGNRGLPASHHLPRASFPCWYDALVTDTERTLMAFIHSAVRGGVAEVEVRSHVREVELVRRSGRVVAAHVEGLGEVEIGCVLRCVGATRPGQPVALAMNVVVPERVVTAEGRAVALRHPRDGRNVFAVPWRGRTIVGTHCRPLAGPPEGALRVEPHHVDEVVDWLRPVHPSFAQLQRGDVRFVHAGLLPRARADADALLERPSVVRRDDGIIDVQGVKWTTACAASRTAVDVALRVLRRRARRVADEPLVDVERDAVPAYVAADPARTQVLVPGLPDLTRGRVLFAIDHEWAQAIDDVLLRRTGVASAGHPGLPIVETVARVMQERLGWSDAERLAHIAAFNADFRFAGNVPVD